MDRPLTNKNVNLSDTERSPCLPKIKEPEILGKVIFVKNTKKNPKFLNFEIQAYGRLFKAKNGTSLKTLLSSSEMIGNDIYPVWVLDA